MWQSLIRQAVAPALAQRKRQQSGGGVVRTSDAFVQAWTRPLAEVIRPPRSLRRQRGGFIRAGHRQHMSAPPADAPTPAICGKQQQHQHGGFIRAGQRQHSSPPPTPAAAASVCQQTQQPQQQQPPQQSAGRRRLKKRSARRFV
jgi:hypothetical protein